MLLSRLINNNLRSENSCLCGMNKLKQIQAHSLKNGIDNNHVLILQLLQVPNIPYARSLLVNIPNPTVLLYNLFIKAYSSQNQPQECLSLYSQMCFHGCPPNHHSFTLLFAACTALSSLSHGRRLHTHLIKSGFHSDAFASTALLDTYAKLGMLGSARQVFDEIPVRDIPTWNSMIAGYARCGKLEEALALFEQMPCRSVVSWTAMISGYSQNGQYGNALAMFLNMEKEKTVRPNEVTIASVIPACANLGALEVGKRIEAYARDNGLFSNIYVSNSLLEMYARCGEIEVAWRVFEEIGKRRNLCTWNSMIMGMAVHGRCKEAFELYHQMLREGTSPDDVTIVGLLLACTHGGMVTKGEELFDSMERRFFIIPKLEHYGCMVDLLGRAGKLQKAYDLIERMPMKPDSVVWGTLLGACSFHRNIELGEKAAKSLFKLDPWNPGNYVILSNIYACTGRWDKVAELRKLMKGGQITKAAGYSFIEVGGDVHKFIVEDKSHLRSTEIYALLNEVSTWMRLQRTGADSESEHEELCTMESI